MLPARLQRVARGLPSPIVILGAATHAVVLQQRLYT